MAESRGPRGRGGAWAQDSGNAPHRSRNLTLVRPERDSSLFFRLFSLELTSTTQGQRTVAEISEIRRKRPGGGMDSDFSLNDIRRLGEQRRLNALLASNLDSFVEIYKNLEILIGLAALK